MTPGDPIEDYAGRLRKSLVGFSVSEREEIVEEIRTHVHDRVASGLSVDDTLARLGTPEDLAKNYRSGALVRRAKSSFSPWTILKATFRWGMTGVQGLSVSLLAVFGYGCGAALIITALLRPLFPGQTGVWIGPDDFVIGFRPAGSPDVHELLGPWFTQIALGLGVLFFIVTTGVVRKLIPKFRRWRASATSATASALNRA